MNQVLYCFRIIFILMLLSGVGRADIMATLEIPAAGQTVSGIGLVSGWAFSTISGAQLTITLRADGTVVGTVPCCVKRDDVAKAFPDQPQASLSGFGQGINFNLLSSGPHMITVEISDDKGSTPIVLEHQITVVRVGDFEFLSQLNLFGASVNLDNQEIIIEEVQAVEKGTDKTQEVKIRLAWQENRQALGIVESENTGTASASTRALKEPESPPVRTAAQEATGAINAELENPPKDSTVSGIGLISGWAFPTTSGATISAIQIRADDVPFASGLCCTARADVASAFPDNPQALNSGFAAPVNFNVLPTGTRTIEVEVQDSTGASHSINHAVIAIRLGGFQFIDQFDLSDAEAQIDGVVLALSNVKVRDKVSQQTRTVSARFAWQVSCQCFVVQASCGNGSVETTEECDGSNLGVETCSSLGFGGGNLICRDTCVLETKDCTGGPSLYVTNTLSNTVSVISAATNLETDTIAVGREPRGIAVSPDGATAYVANARDNNVSIVDTATKTVSGTVTVGKRPQGVAFAPDGTKVYVANGLDNSVSVIDTTTKQIIATIPVGREPQAIALLPNGTFAYVTNFADDVVTVLNTATDTADTAIPVGEGPDGVAVSPDGTRAYVANFNGDSVSVIDTATNQTIGDPLTVGLQPAKVAFSPDGKRAYTTNALDFSVSVIDTEKEETISPGLFVIDEPDGVVVLPNGRRVYVAIFGQDGLGREVMAFSTVNNGSVATIEVGKAPFAVAVVPARP